MPPLESVLSSSLPTSANQLASHLKEGKVKHDKDTVIVFDWDDTLLCSSFLSSKGVRLDTDRTKHPELDAPLKELESSTCAVLQLALTYGQVHIITNAETGWVQLSAQKFIPGVLPLLQHVSVISARSTYEAMFPDSPLKWKYYAFQERLSPTFNSTSKKERNILSFGDSHVEREAVRAVTRGYANTRCKSVKFAERPSLEQLRRQIELVTNCFQYIHNHEGDLDLQLTVTVNPAASQNNPSPAQHVTPSTSHAPASPGTGTTSSPSAGLASPAHASASPLSSSLSLSSDALPNPHLTSNPISIH